jgi:serine/threonine-protein kinase
MAEKQPAPSVRALEDTYTIVGELRGSEGVRKYIAKRRDDGAEVIVSVYSAPGGGANNELSHFAADVQLLSRLSHPGLARVFEARWLGPGALAVVNARVPGKTLAESLKSGEAFSNPRAAVVLQEIWGVLDWARTSGVVHRGVTPDNVYFLPQSQHV